jgi:Ca2+-binding RTX toxin-like protein
MGDDILIGNGGMDVFNAGAGNDTIIINASNITALADILANPEAFTESPPLHNTLRILVLVEASIVILA